MIEEREMNQLKLKEMNERNVSLMRQLSHRVKGEQGVNTIDFKNALTVEFNC